MSYGEGTPADVGELVELLDLEVLDRDLFRARNARHRRMWPRLFGGQVAAQALRAATLTVDAERAPHSLHGYFLRPGRSDIATIHRVDRDRDGRSISARRVTAIQDGQVIFTLSASFCTRDTGPDLQPGLPTGTPDPDQAGPSTVPLAHPAFEVRSVTEGHPKFGGLADVYWAKPREALPDDPLVHACVLAYLSDMGVGEGELTPELRDMAEPSVDHAVWLHRPTRMDDWVLFSMRPISAQANRLLYSGSIHARDGNLVASVMQECLLRAHRPPG